MCAFVYVCENLVEVVLTILINLNNGRMYMTQSIITRIFPVVPNDRVIMQSHVSTNWSPVFQNERCVFYLLECLAKLVL